MKTALFLFISLALCSCERKSTPDWGNAPKEYNCTTDQMQKAQLEAEWCIKNTGYFASYCYGTAIIRNCTKK